MTKKDAVNLFGSKTALAKALFVTRQAVHGWSEELTQARTDQCRGAFLRLAEEHDKKLTHVFGTAKAS